MGHLDKICRQKYRGLNILRADGVAHFLWELLDLLNDSRGIGQIIGVVLPAIDDAFPSVDPFIK